MQHFAGVGGSKQLFCNLALALGLDIVGPALRGFAHSSGELLHGESR